MDIYIVLSLAAEKTKQNCIDNLKIVSTTIGAQDQASWCNKTSMAYSSLSVLQLSSGSNIQKGKRPNQTWDVCRTYQGYPEKNPGSEGL